jgi:hypothetical protein
MMKPQIPMQISQTKRRTVNQRRGQRTATYSAAFHPVAGC